MSRPWTDSETRYLREQWRHQTAAQIAAHLGRTAKAVATRAKVLNLRKRWEWTEAEEQTLRERFPHEPTQAVADALGRTYASVANHAAGMGLSKSEAYMAEELARQAERLRVEGVATRRRPGQEPWNKGKSYMPGGRVRAGWFPKGNKPHNTRHDGAISTRRDSGTGRLYKVIRIAEGNWLEMHRKVWEEAHGPVPDGMVVAFLDGDSMNCKLENLHLIDRAELMRRNTVHRYPAELRAAMRTLKKLTKAINDADKKPNF